MNFVNRTQSACEMLDDESSTRITSAWTLALHLFGTGACVGMTGALVGNCDGSADGTAVGCCDGSAVGNSVGATLGSADGSAVGACDGSVVGPMVGTPVGLADGDAE